jgi:hypothetical protein
MHKVGRICTLIVLLAVPTAILLGLVYATKREVCQRAADVLAAVKVCQDARAMCWSSPEDLIEVRRGLRTLESCKEWGL